MRILLSVLLCFVLVQTQSSALHVGDGRGSAQAVDVVGDYSGVLIPASGNEDEFDPLSAVRGIEPQDFEGNNAVAIFSLTIPATGLGTGTLLVFANGRVFTGLITAFADTDSATIVGILEASYNFSVSNPPIITGSTVTIVPPTPVTASAVGKLAASVFAPITISSGANSSLGRLFGNANLDIDFGLLNPDFSPVVVQTLEFIVEGIKQT